MLMALTKGSKPTRFEIVKALLEGDTEVWLLFLGITVPVVLAIFVAGFCLRNRKKGRPTACSPAQVGRASWQSAASWP